MPLLLCRATNAPPDPRHVRVSVTMGSHRLVGEPVRLFGPYEVSRDVDLLQKVEDSDLILLHMRERMPKTRFIAPLCLASR